MFRQVAMEDQLVARVALLKSFSVWKTMFSGVFTQSTFVSLECQESPVMGAAAKMSHPVSDMWSTGAARLLKVVVTIQKKWCVFIRHDSPWLPTATRWRWRHFQRDTLDILQVLFSFCLIEIFTVSCFAYGSCCQVYIGFGVPMHLLLVRTIAVRFFWKFPSVAIHPIGHSIYLKAIVNSTVCGKVEEQ